MKPAVSAAALAWMAAAVGVLALALCSGASCGPSEVRTHAQIADGLGEALDQAKYMIEFRGNAEESALRAQFSGPELDARMVALRAKWTPVVAAHGACVELQNAYRTAVQAAHASEEKRVGHAFALALLAKWQSLLELALAAGLELPPIPQYLRNEAENGQQ